MPGKAPIENYDCAYSQFYKGYRLLLFRPPKDDENEFVYKGRGIYWADSFFIVPSFRGLLLEIRGGMGGGSMLVGIGGSGRFCTGT